MVRYMTHKICLLAATVAALTVAATASATTDPRTCTYGPDRKADCARDAAKLVARRYLARIAHQTYLWQAPMTCSGAGSLLRWRCTFDSSIPSIGKGDVLVVYRATTKGWTVRATIERTG